MSFFFFIISVEILKIISNENETLKIIFLTHPIQQIVGHIAFERNISKKEDANKIKPIGYEKKLTSRFNTKTEKVYILENQNNYHNYTLPDIHNFSMNIQKSYIPLKQIPSLSISQNHIRIPYIHEQQIHLPDTIKQNTYNQPNYKQYLHEPQIPHNHIPQENIYEHHIAEKQINKDYIKVPEKINFIMLKPEILPLTIPDISNMTLISKSQDGKQEIYKMTESDVSLNVKMIHLIPKIDHLSKNEKFISSKDFLGENFRIKKQGILPLTIPDISNMTLISQSQDGQSEIYKMTESDIPLRLRIIRNIAKKYDEFPLNRPMASISKSNWIYGRKFIQRFIDAIENMEYYIKKSNSTKEIIFIKCIIDICIKTPPQVYFKKGYLRQCCNKSNFEQYEVIDIYSCKIFTSHLSSINYDIWNIIRQKYKDIKFIY